MLNNSNKLAEFMKEFQSGQFNTQISSPNSNNNFLNKNNLSNINNNFMNRTPQNNMNLINNYNNSNNRLMPTNTNNNNTKMMNFGTLMTAKQSTPFGNNNRPTNMMSMFNSPTTNKFGISTNGKMNTGLAPYSGMMMKPASNNNMGLAPAPVSAAPLFNSAANVNRLMNAPTGLNNNLMRINNNNGTQMFNSNNKPFMGPSTSNAVSQKVPNINTANPMMNLAAQNNRGYNNFYNQGNRMITGLYNTGLYNNLNTTGLNNNLNTTGLYNTGLYNNNLNNNRNMNAYQGPGMYNNNYYNANNRYLNSNNTNNGYGFSNNRITNVPTSNLSQSSQNINISALPAMRMQPMITGGLSNSYSNLNNLMNNMYNSMYMNNNMSFRKFPSFTPYNYTNSINNIDNNRFNDLERGRKGSVDEDKESVVMSEIGIYKPNARMDNIRAIADYYYLSVPVGGSEQAKQENRVVKMENIIDRKSNEKDYMKNSGLQIMTLEKKFKNKLEKYRTKLEQIADLYNLYEPPKKPEGGEGAVVRAPKDKDKEVENLLDIETINGKIETANKEILKDMNEIKKEITNLAGGDDIPKKYLEDRIDRVIKIIEIQGYVGQQNEGDDTIRANMDKLTNSINEMMDAGSKLNDDINGIIYNEGKDDELERYKYDYIEFINKLNGAVLGKARFGDFVKNLKNKQEQLSKEIYINAAKFGIYKDWKEIPEGDTFLIENILDYFYENIKEGFRKDTTETLPIVGIFPVKGVRYAARICDECKGDIGNWHYKIARQFNDNDYNAYMQSAYNSKDVVKNVNNQQIIDNVGAKKSPHYNIYVYKSAFLKMLEILNKCYLDERTNYSYVNEVKKIEQKKQNAKNIERQNEQIRARYDRDLKAYERKAEERKNLPKMQERYDAWKREYDKLDQQNQAAVRAYLDAHPEPENPQNLQQLIRPNKNDYRELRVPELTAKDKIFYKIMSTRLEYLEKIRDKIAVIIKMLEDKQKECDKLIAREYTSYRHGDNNQLLQKVTVKDIFDGLRMLGLDEIYDYYCKINEMKKIQKNCLLKSGKTLGIYTDKIRNENEFMECANDVWEKIKQDQESLIPAVNLENINLKMFDEYLNNYFKLKMDNLCKIIQKYFDLKSRGQDPQQNMPGNEWSILIKYNNMIAQSFPYQNIEKISTNGLDDVSKYMEPITNFLNNEKVKPYIKTFSNIINEFISFDGEGKKVEYKGISKEIMDLVNEIKNIKISVADVGVKVVTGADNNLQRMTTSLNERNRDYSNTKKEINDYLEANHIQNRELMNNVIKDMDDLYAKRGALKKTYTDMFGKKLFAPLIQKMDDQFAVDRYMDLTIDEKLATSYAEDLRPYLDKTIEDSIKKTIKSVFNMYSSKLKADIEFNSRKVKEEMEKIGDDQDLYEKEKEKKYVVKDYERYFQFADPLIDIEKKDVRALIETKSIFDIMSDKLREKDSYLNQILADSLGDKKGEEYEKDYKAIKEKYDKGEYENKLNWNEDDYKRNREIETFAKNYNGVRITKLAKYLNIKSKEINDLAKSINEAKRYLSDFGIDDENEKKLEDKITEYKNYLKDAQKTVNSNNTKFIFLEDEIKEIEKKIMKYEKDILSIVAKPFVSLVYKKFNYLNAYKDIAYFFVKDANKRLNEGIVTEDRIQKIENIVKSIQIDLESDINNIKVLDIENISEMEKLFKTKFGIDLKKAFEYEPLAKDDVVNDIIDDETTPTVVNTIETMWRMMGLFKKLNNKYDMLYKQFDEILKETVEEFKTQMDDKQIGNGMSKRDSEFGYIKSFIEKCMAIYENIKIDAEDYEIDQKEMDRANIDTTIFNKVQMGIEIIKYMEDGQDGLQQNSELAIPQIKELGDEIIFNLKGEKENHDMEKDVLKMIFKNMGKVMPGIDKKIDIENALLDEDNIMDINEYIIEDLNTMEFKDGTFKKTLLGIFKAIKEARKKYQEYKDRVDEAINSWIEYLEIYKEYKEDVEGRQRTEQEKTIYDMIQTSRAVVLSALCTQNGEYYSKTKEYVEKIQNIITEEAMEDIRKKLNSAGNTIEAKLFDIIEKQIVKMVKNDVITEGEKFIENAIVSLETISGVKGEMVNEGRENIDTMIRIIKRKKADCKKIGEKFQNYCDKIMERLNKENYDNKENIETFDNILRCLQSDEYIGKRLLKKVGNILSPALTGLSLFQRNYKLDKWREERKLNGDLETIRNAEYFNNFRNKMTDDDKMTYNEYVKNKKYKDWESIAEIKNIIDDMIEEMKIIKNNDKSENYGIRMFTMEDCNSIIKTLNLIKKNISDAVDEKTPDEYIGDIVKELPNIFKIIQGLKENIESYKDKFKNLLIRKVTGMVGRAEGVMKSNRDGNTIKYNLHYKLITALNIIMRCLNKLKEFNLSDEVIIKTKKILNFIEKDMQNDTQNSIGEILKETKFYDIQDYEKYMLEEPIFELSKTPGGPMPKIEEDKAGEFNVFMKNIVGTMKYGGKYEEKEDEKDDEEGMFGPSKPKVKSRISEPKYEITTSLGKEGDEDAGDDDLLYNESEMEAEVRTGRKKVGKYKDHSLEKELYNSRYYEYKENKERENSKKKSWGKFN